MAEAAASPPTAATTSNAAGPSLKDQGNELFKSGNYLKAAATYTRAIKADPRNPTLYSNRSAAFLHLFKLNKALADAEETISLNSQWDKGYFRKGCVLEAMKRYDEAVAAFQVALQHNSQSIEISKKIKGITQILRETKRAKEIENLRSSIDMTKFLDPLKTELSDHFGAAGGEDIFNFLVSSMESAIKAWHETGKVDSKINFLLDEQRTQTDKYGPVVNIDKAFESPHTHVNCFSSLRQYIEESFAKAGCLIASKSEISYPQVWKGQGSRKWRHGQTDGFFVQFESPVLRKLWFVPSTTEKGKILCMNPEALDIGAHEVLPRLFKGSMPNV